MKKIFHLLTVFIILLSGCNNDPETPENPQSLPDNYISSIYIDTDGIKYFATKKGLASFDGNNWKVYTENSKIAAETINDLDMDKNNGNSELWMGTDKGANVAFLPVDAVSGATTYTSSNTKTLFPGEEPLPGDSVFSVRIDDNYIRWFGTNGGLAAFKGSSWPKIDLGFFYDNNFFVKNRISGMDYSADTLYIATRGGGVARMVAPDIDAITAASSYVIPWSFLPSNNVLCVFTDGNVQWFGTDEGLAKHTGIQAKMNWETFSVTDGLISNKVQCINKDSNGNIWIGTPEGISVLNGTQWKNYTKSDGLVNNNVLCIAVDIDGKLWVGTSNGVSVFDGVNWTSYVSD